MQFTFTVFEKDQVTIAQEGGCCILRVDPGDTSAYSQSISLIFNAQPNVKAAFRAIVAEWDKAEGITQEAEIWPISVEADGRWFYVACTTHGEIGRKGSPSEAAIMGSKHLYALHPEIVGVGI